MSPLRRFGAAESLWVVVFDDVAAAPAPAEGQAGDRYQDPTWSSGEHQLVALEEAIGIVKGEINDILCLPSMQGEGKRVRGFEPPRFGRSKR